MERDGKKNISVSNLRECKQTARWSFLFCLFPDEEEPNPINSECWYQSDKIRIVNKSAWGRTWVLKATCICTQCLDFISSSSIYLLKDSKKNIYF